MASLCLILYTPIDLGVIFYVPVASFDNKTACLLIVY